MEVDEFFNHLEIDDQRTFQIHNFLLYLKSIKIIFFPISFCYIYLALLTFTWVRFRAVRGVAV
jgi:hypothetical protein